MNTETAIQNRIRVTLSEYGVVFRQNSGLLTDSRGNRVRVGVPGMSDLLYIGEPRINSMPTVAWLEVKTENGKASKEQKAFINAMRSAGCVAGIVRSPDDALKLLKLEVTPDEGD